MEIWGVKGSSVQIYKTRPTKPRKPRRDDYRIRGVNPVGCKEYPGPVPESRALC